MSENVLLRVAAKGVISYQGKVLILREADTYEDGSNVGRWHMPGGRIEADESYYDGLAREVKEETGLTVVPKEPIYLGEWWPEIRGQKNHIVALFMVCESSTDKVVLSEEHDKFAWVDPSDFADYDVMDPEDKVLEAFVKRQS